MRRLALGGLLWLLLCGAAAAIEMLHVRVFGQDMIFMAALRDGKPYLPLTAAAESLQANIEWDADQDMVSVNGFAMKERPWHYQGVVYVPVEPLAHMLGLRAEQVAGEQLLVIEHAGVTTRPPAPHKPAAQKSAHKAPPKKKAAAAQKKAATPTNGAADDRPHAVHLPIQPAQASDGVFLVNVMDVTELSAIKGYYKPRPGYRFLMLSLSQQNVSQMLQIYSGRFLLLDSQSHTYEILESVSHYHLAILQPGSINFGYVIYEVPRAAHPVALLLQYPNAPSLKVKLRR